MVVHLCCCCCRWYYCCPDGGSYLVSVNVLLCCVVLCHFFPRYKLLLIGMLAGLMLGTIDSLDDDDDTHKNTQNRKKKQSVEFCCVICEKQWKFNFPPPIFIILYFNFYDFLFFFLFCFFYSSPTLHRCAINTTASTVSVIEYTFCSHPKKTLNCVELLLWGAAAGRGNIHFFN